MSSIGVDRHRLDSSDSCSAAMATTAAFSVFVTAIATLYLRLSCTWSMLGPNVSGCVCVEPVGFPFPSMPNMGRCFRFVNSVGEAEVRDVREVAGPFRDRVGVAASCSTYTHEAPAIRRQRGLEVMPQRNPACRESTGTRGRLLIAMSKTRPRSCCPSVARRPPPIRTGRPATGHE